jgi:hypothetical protein
MEHADAHEEVTTMRLHAPLGRPSPFGLLHVPKTGGTTLNSLFVGLFGVNRVLVQDGPAPPAVSDSLLARCQFVSGHFTYAELSACIRADRRLLSLRHPASRVRSLWEHIGRDPESFGGSMARLARSSLEEFFRNRPDHPGGEGRNAMCYLIGAPLRPPAVPLPVEAVFELAIERVRQAGCLFLQEMLADCLELFSTEFGYPALTLPSSRNVRSSDVNQVEREAHALAREFDAHDIALWEFAAELHAERRASAFRRMLDAQFHAGRTGPPPQRCLSAQQPWISRGFQTPEGSGDGRYWRWTGPGLRSELFLSPSLFAGDDVAVRIEVINEVLPLTIYGTELLFNDAWLESEKVNRSDGVVEIRARLSLDQMRSVAERGRAVLSFVTPWVSPLPVSPNHPGDRVSVGIAVSRLLLE